MIRSICLVVSYIFLSTLAFSQIAPLHTAKRFVESHDTSKFKNIKAENGIGRTYVVMRLEIWDTDDLNTTHVKRIGPALVCVEGEYKHGKRNGVFHGFVIDDQNHTNRYKMFEQTYSNGKLSGEFRIYNIKGTRISLANFKEDSLYGVSKDFWIDGIRLMEEREYYNGSSKFYLKEFDKDGKLEREMLIENDIPVGLVKSYYPNGILKEEINVVDGKLEGIRKYYYPTGEIWSELEYKDGKPWNMVSNMEKSGKKRNGGTLKNGNGTTLLYNEDGTFRKTIKYINGIEVGN